MYDLRRSAMSVPHVRYRTHGRRRAALAVAAVVGLSGVAVPTLAGFDSAAAKPPSAPWLNSHKSVAGRVNALLKAMTLEEKVGQMDQQLVTTLTDSNGARCGDNGFNLPNPA